MFAATGPMTGGRNATLLLVDDDSDTCEALQTVLQDAMPGLHVVTAPNAASARRFMAELRLDALLVDLQLPDADGIDLIRELTAKGPRLPSILITGHAETAVAMRAVNDAGVRGFFAKPVQPDELVWAVKRELQWGSGRPGRIPAQGRRFP